MASIFWGMDQLNIKHNLIFSSDLSINSTGTQRLVDICKEVGATEYISGIGGKSYLEHDLFECRVTYKNPVIKNYYSVIQNVREGILWMK